MASYGRILRQAATQDAHEAALCRCGHTVRQHAEKNPRFDPDYDPLVFHCTECDCRIDAKEAMR